jgi:serine/threonine protein phosphatase PrpC
MSDSVELGPLGDAALGWAFVCSRAGSSHRRIDQPCQDACALRYDSVAARPFLAVAVADGHGDQRHDRSETGAGLAVEIAVEELAGLLRRQGAEGGSYHLKANFKTDFPRRVCRLWREKVRADAHARDETDAAADNQTLLTRYGTTLLAALVVGDVLLVGQIGDGSIFLRRPDSTVECLLPGVETDVGMVTNSLCSPEAHCLWRTATLERTDGGLLLLATDGLTNAFADQTQLHTFVRSLDERVRQYGQSKVAASLPGWLDHYSEFGSGDDITLAVVALRSTVAAPAASIEEKQATQSRLAKETDNVVGDRTAGNGGDCRLSPDSEGKAW